MKMFSLATRNFKEIYRDPVSILLGLVLPIGMLLIFTSINKRIPLEIFSVQSLTPGVVIFGFTFIIMFSSLLLAKDKQSAFLIRLFTTPLKPSDFILSYMVPFFPLAFIQIAVCLFVGTILGASFSNLFASLLIFVLIASVCISLGIIIGSLFTLNQVSGIGSILITATGLFSGIWMDLKMVGGIFEKIGYALPFAHAVDALKALLNGENFSGIVKHFYFISIFAILLFILAILSFKRTMKKI